jgi:cytoskeletal protein CcmA (bactofilin family)
MWNREQSPNQPSQPAAAPPSDAAASRTGGIVGETMRIKGDIFSASELQVNGEVEGSLESQSRLTIGPKGKVDANIKATEVIVSGAIHGNVEAATRIVLRNGANLVGDVKTAGIVIEDGAYFKGGIDITRPEVAAQDPPPAQAEPQPRLQPGAAARA